MHNKATKVVSNANVDLSNGSGDPKLSLGNSTVLLDDECEP